jgi:hypothetical protein
MKKTVLIIYSIGILFLLVSAVTDFQTKAYWALYMDIEFIGFALYMIFGYPKRKLKLNQDLMTFLMIHFSVYALMSLLAENWVLAISSGGFSIGLLIYRLYRKKHKYSLYLK